MPVPAVVIPAAAGIHNVRIVKIAGGLWIPAVAGMTDDMAG